MKLIKISDTRVRENKSNIEADFLIGIGYQGPRIFSQDAGT